MENTKELRFHRIDFSFLLDVDGIVNTNGRQPSWGQGDGHDNTVYARTRKNGKAYISNGRIRQMIWNNNTEYPSPDFFKTTENFQRFLASETGLLRGAMVDNLRRRSAVFLSDADWCAEHNTKESDGTCYTEIRTQSSRTQEKTTKSNINFFRIQRCGKRVKKVDGHIDLKTLQFVPNQRGSMNFAENSEPFIEYLKEFYKPKTQDNLKQDQYFSILDRLKYPIAGILLPKEIQKVAILDLFRRISDISLVCASGKPFINLTA